MCKNRPGYAFGTSGIPIHNTPRVRDGLILFGFCKWLICPKVRSSLERTFEQMNHVWKFCVKCSKSRPRGYKTFFMLNSTEHEISTAPKN